MNAIQDKAAFLLPDISTGDDRWSKLMALADMMEIDELTGALTITNGKSSLTLRKDGRIFVKGVSITQQAERSIALDAAVIDLN
ncbi:hypothetical protein FS764_06610 [Agrobacterium vitis]|uniref:hypothetical protein n=1 Tax=Agrobacterium vitis TaxID=373 RepID=UPI00087263AF|nr:hypothetical protein [Agrobacterium vitis]MCE6074085.1 hypothetical protein [Agrobacterium vitis]MCF1466582.1 hypothetical protein [Agrobacterium vitis]MCM2450417.1 hypothetical protein [Agrobacterium vitis]MCM2468915.1 hypothetical protein [Agrobacterium vitis]MUO72285.1 hypothetical protein [Agrobacterium vitis]